VKEKITSQFACVGCPNKFCCDIRDTHTRSEIAKRLKAYMEEYEGDISLVLFKIDRLIKELEEPCQTKK